MFRCLWSCAIILGIHPQAEILMFLLAWGMLPFANTKNPDDVHRAGVKAKKIKSESLLVPKHVFRRTVSPLNSVPGPG